MKRDRFCKCPSIYIKREFVSLSYQTHIKQPINLECAILFGVNTSETVYNPKVGKTSLIGMLLMKESTMKDWDNMVFNSESISF